MSNSALNAMKHGCCAVDFRLLPGESEKEFKNLERLYNEGYRPKGDFQQKLVAELVNADWLLQRATKALLEIETRLYAKSTNPLDWTEQEQRTLARFQRYRTAHANTVARCCKAIEDYRKYRATEVILAQKVEINDQRLKSAQKKNEPKTEPNWKEHLEQMKQKAISLGFTPPEHPDPTKR